MKRLLKVLAYVALIFFWLGVGPVSTIRASALAAAAIPPACTYSPITASVINQTTEATYGGWIQQLSGAVPVTVGGQPYTITTRFSPALFNGSSLAFNYLLEQVQALYPASQVEEQSYSGNYLGGTWKNLIVTIPGRVHPDQVVIMSAHFDSTSASRYPPYLPAPGADDNASGSASLLEAARLLRDLPLDRTMKLIWFTGEEQGLWGSGAYVHDNNLAGIIGVVNLDMFAYDSNKDRCFEIHVSQSPSQLSAAASNAVGQCMTRAISDYGLDLTYDYFTTGATDRSDHASFWPFNIGAIEVGQNFFTSSTPNGCVGADENPNYHTANDTFANINLPYALSIHKAALATVIDMAGPLDLSTLNFLYFPLLTNHP